MSSQNFKASYAGVAAELQKAAEMIHIIDEKNVLKVGQNLATIFQYNSKWDRKAFADIQTVDDLKLYLDDIHQRLRSSIYLYHYTTVSRVIEMIRGRRWHLGNAYDMNDKLEYKYGDAQRWENLFFACFMCEDMESIGMWSMYAQPWEKGVKIAIPKSIVQKWLKSVKEIEEISIETYKPTGRIITVDKDNVSLRLSAVAYSNSDSLENSDNEEKVTCGTVSNNKLARLVHARELTGYIKDMAWSYEKEIRVKVEFNNIYNCRRVAIPITDDVIDSMIITASPLFDGDLSQEVEKEIHRQIRTDRSIFTNKLSIKTICQECEYKKPNEV